MDYLAKKRFLICDNSSRRIPGYSVISGLITPTILARVVPSTLLVLSDGAQEENAVARKDDEDLFFLDRAGKQDRKKRHKPKTSRSDLAEEQSRKQKGSKIVQLTSRTFYERRSLKRKKRQRGKATAELNDDDEEGIDSIPGVRKIPKRGEIPEDSVGMDIWGGGGGSAAKNTSKKRIKKAISEKSLAKSKYSKPLGAQSYNPLAEKQQELIQESAWVLSVVS
eukprot:jgi/Bigna1/84863/estExt_fgenesh1_pg.C_10234